MPQLFFFSSIDAITSGFDIKSSSSLTINQNMPQKKEVSQEKFIQYAIMDAILNQIETEKQERVLSLDLESKSYSERSVSYGLSNEIINRHKRANPWLTRDMLNNYKRSKRGNRLKEGEDPVMDDAAAAAGGNTEVLAAMGNNDGDEGGVVPVVEALLQIGTAV